MRKVSKNRADDDVVSSTNGSVTNEQEDQPAGSEEQQQPAEEKDDEHDSQPEEEEEATENGNHSDDDPSFDENAKDKKKKSSKSKPKKKKSTKAKKQEEYEVEKVVGSKKIKGKLHYLIRWKGYSADSDTWEPENTVSCPDLVSKYNDEKENSKKKDSSESKSKTSGKRGRPAKKGGSSKSPAKRPRKEEWDGENADENAEYEVDRILEVHHKKNGKREFLIHWKGWSTKFDSWEPENNLNCPDLIKKFMEKVNTARSKDSRSLRVAPETTSRFTLQAPTTGRRLSKRGGQRQRVRYDDAE